MLHCLIDAGEKLVCIGTWTQRVRQKRSHYLFMFLVVVACHYQHGLVVSPIRRFIYQDGKGLLLQTFHHRFHRCRCQGVCCKICCLRSLALEVFGHLTVWKHDWKEAGEMVGHIKWNVVLYQGIAKENFSTGSFVLQNSKEIKN